MDLPEAGSFGVHPGVGSGGKERLMARVSKKQIVANEIVMAARMPVVQVVDGLIALLVHDDPLVWPVVRDAIRTLGTIGIKRLAVTIAETKDDRLRLYATMLLGETGRPSGFEFREFLMSDPGRAELAWIEPHLLRAAREHGDLKFNHALAYTFKCLGLELPLVVWQRVEARSGDGGRS
jgi:hypothetical protein